MIGTQPRASAITAYGTEPTLCRAGSAAEANGRMLAKGGRFNCPRLGMLTRAKCLENLMAGHPACTTGFTCGIGAGEAKKEGIEMPKKFKKGDCACGKKDVQLDSEGRCYQCRDKARWAAQKAAKEAAGQARKPSTPPPATPGAEAPAEVSASIQGHSDANDGQMVGPKVQEAGEKLREAIPPEGQLVGDEDPAPGVAGGWPETGGTLVIEGMEFEVVPVGKNAKIHNAVVSFRACAIAFSADAVRKHSLGEFKFLRIHKAPGVVGFEFLAGREENTRTICRQAKDTASLACTIHRLKEFFPGLSGKQFPLELTNRDGFFVARVG